MSLCGRRGAARVTVGPGRPGPAHQESSLNRAHFGLALVARAVRPAASRLHSSAGSPLVPRTAPRPQLPRMTSESEVPSLRPGPGCQCRTADAP